MLLARGSLLVCEPLRSLFLGVPQAEELSFSPFSNKEGRDLRRAVNSGLCF